MSRGERDEVCDWYIEEGRNEPIKDLDNAKKVVLVDRNKVGAEDITFAYCRFEAETSSHKKHIHKDAKEVIYILEGKGVSGVSDMEVEMKKGDTMFVPRGVVNWFCSPFPEPVEMLFVYTRPSLKSTSLLWLAPSLLCSALP